MRLVEELEHVALGLVGELRAAAAREAGGKRGASKKLRRLRTFQMSPVMVLANEPEWPPTWLLNSGARPEPVRLGGAVESVVDAVATDVEGSAADMELGARGARRR